MGINVFACQKKNLVAMINISLCIESLFDRLIGNQSVTENVELL